MSLKNPVTPPEIDAGTARLVAQRINHYATPGPIKINAEWRLKFVSVLANEDCISAQKIMRRAENGRVVDGVNKWFLQQGSQGQLISGPVVLGRSLVTSDTLGGDPQFQASIGWLKNFKAWQGIRTL
jgi:hypothetical protein